MTPFFLVFRSNTIESWWWFSLDTLLLLMTFSFSEVCILHRSLSVSDVNFYRSLLSSYKSHSRQGHLLKRPDHVTSLHPAATSGPCPSSLSCAILHAPGTQQTSFWLIFYTQGLHTDFESDIPAFARILTQFPITVVLHISA